jgi:sulfoxide reductase heme-binding subunit YedZ
MRRLGWTAAKTVVHLLVLLPLALLAVDAATGNLSADPVREITARLGMATLLVLTASLSCTPVHILTGVRGVLRFRRMLGLYSFAYACLHVITLVGLDYGFDWRLLYGDVLEKRFALFGIAAFLFLVPLAVTSSRRWAEWLGPRWDRLHRLAYPAGVLAAAHFIAQTKAGFLTPGIYAALIALLLFLRIPVVRRTVISTRGKFLAQRHS